MHLQSHVEGTAPNSKKDELIVRILDNEYEEKDGERRHVNDLFRVAAIIAIASEPHMWCFVSIWAAHTVDMRVELFELFFVSKIADAEDRDHNYWLANQCADLEERPIG